MTTIEAIVTVTPDGKAVFQLPPDILPGRHKVVMAIDEQLIKEQPAVETDVHAAALNREVAVPALPDMRP